MASIEIYTSEGTRYGGDQTRPDQRISDFFVGQVRLAVDTSGYRSEVVAFFRAKEGTAGRSNQFYAVYETDAQQGLLEKFKRAVRGRVEDELGLTLASSSDTAVFDNLDASMADLVGRGGPDIDTMDQKALQLIYRRGENADFNVPDYETGIAIVRGLIDSTDSGKIAISDGGRIDALSGYDIVLEPDSSTYQTLQPTDGTDRLMEEMKSNLEGQIVDEKINAIKDDIRDIKRNTSLSDNEIRRRLKREVSLFSRDRGTTGTGTDFESGTGISGGTNAGIEYGGSSSKDESILQKVPLTVVAPFAIVLVLIMLVVGIQCMATLPVVGQYMPVCSGEFSINHPKDKGVYTSPLIVNGTADSSMVNVTAESDGSKKYYTIPVNKGEFSGKLELSSGNYTIIIQPAKKAKNNTELLTPKKKRNITIKSPGSNLSASSPTPTSSPTSTPSPMPITSPTPTSSPRSAQNTSTLSNSTSSSTSSNSTSSSTSSNSTSSRVIPVTGTFVFKKVAHAGADN